MEISEKPPLALYRDTNVDRLADQLTENCRAELCGEICSTR